MFNKLDVGRFKCEFCSNTFQTEDKFNEHVLEHFERKNCQNCDKFLIRIGSEWYELHVDDFNQKDFEDQKDELTLTDIAEVKVEESEEILEFNDSNVGDEKSSKIEDFISENDSNEESDMSDEYQITRNKRKKQTRSRKEHTKKKIQSIEDDQSIESTNTQKREGSQSRRRGRLARIPCRICDRIILKYNFDAHLQKMHVPRIIVPNEKVKCETCGKFFASAGNLKIHQAIHSGTKRFGMFEVKEKNGFHRHFHLYSSDVTLFIFLQCAAIVERVFVNFTI